VERETRLAAIGTLASQVVHDVRNGLTALLARTDFARTKQPAGSVDRDLTIIEGLAVRLNRNLQDILDFARGDDVKLKRQPILARDLVQRLEDELASTFQHAHVALTTTLEGSLDVPLNVDIDRLHRAIENLLLNARAAVVVSRPAVPEVALTLQIAADELNVIVDDSGPGLEAEAISRLFSTFEAHGSTAGNGLGLATVRNVARAHGGEVHVLGNGPLGGARFHIWLPNT
ncbi:MAG: HAMP domain-containing histidine kinase, partial [Clostridia bacterium]|nr:HAMP domain-containing histidine kinase [Deltaproteobacteria bacterium]